MHTVGQLNQGDRIAPRALVNIEGQPVPIPADGLIHLQFRRYAGCPVCNMHLRSIAVRHQELVGAGITEVVVFHSSTSVMQEFQAELPFDAIADPDRVLYAEFGVGSITVRNFWKGLTLRSWRTAVRALRAAPTLKGALGRGERHLGLPAELLIDGDGRVLAAHYGEHVDDHWSVDDVLTLAREA
jgi:peroxiredoxin